MNCPECDEEMEREDKVAVEGGVISREPIREVFYGAEYFCLCCHQSYYWNNGNRWHKGGLEPIGTYGSESAKDVIACYGRLEVDSAGQVW
jgi:hypothetical protein